MGGVRHWVREGGCGGWVCVGVCVRVSCEWALRCVCDVCACESCVCATVRACVCV